jgi:zinc transporter ZupT
MGSCDLWCACSAGRTRNGYRYSNDDAGVHDAMPRMMRSPMRIALIASMFAAVIVITVIATTSYANNIQLRILLDVLIGVLLTLGVIGLVQEIKRSGAKSH